MGGRHIPNCHFFKNCIFIFILALLTGGYANSNVENFTHPIQNNGLFYFLARTLPELEDPEEKIPKPDQAIEQWRNFIEKSFVRKALDQEKPFLYQNQVQLPLQTEIQATGLSSFVKNKRPNIVLIILESFNADRLGTYNQQSTLSPNFDHLAKKGILFQNFYANGRQTMRGQFSLFCGLYPNPGEGIFRAYFRTKFNCLPKILQKYGYQSAWIHSHDGNFDNQAIFLTINGFNHITTQIDFENGEELSWGYSDQDLMEKSIQV